MFWVIFNQQMKKDCTTVRMSEQMSHTKESEKITTRVYSH